MGDEVNQLYEACVGYMVSDQSKKNSWELVCKEVSRLLAIGEDMAGIRAALEAVEEQVRKDYGVTKLPNAWRSAKSVALNAAGCGVPLVHDDGVVPGKTYIEREIRVPSTPVAPSWMEVADDLARVARKIKALTVTPTGVEEAALVNSLFLLKDEFVRKGVRFA